MRRFSPALFAAALNGAMCLTPLAAHAQDAYLGEIRTFAFTFCPVGWAPLNGQIVPIAGNTALFSLLGINYGGNGTTNFAYPTAKPIFTGNGFPFTQCIATSGIFPPRN